MSKNLTKMFKLARKKPAGPNLNEQPLFSEEIDRRGWVKWGEDNLAPMKLIELSKKSAVHNRIFKDKSMMVGGNGFVKDKLSKKALDFLDNIYNEDDMDEILAKVSTDYELFGSFALNLVWDVSRTFIAEVNYIDVSTLRVAFPKQGCTINDIKGYYLSNDWSDLRRYQPLYVPAFSLEDRESENCILYYKGNTRVNRFYGEPDYMAGMNNIELEWKISRFHNNGISNGLQAGAMVTFLGGIPSDEEMATEAYRLKQDFQGEENSQDIIINFADNKDNAPFIQALPSNGSDKYFIELNKQVTDGILQAHRVSNGIIFGKSLPGQLGNKDEMLEALAIFQSNYITPRQRDIEKVFRKILDVNKITDMLKIEKYTIEFNKITAGVENTVAICSNSSLTPEQKYYILIHSGFEEKQSQQLSGFIPVIEEDKNNPIIKCQDK